MNYKFLPPEDEKEIRMAVENNEYVTFCYVKQLLKEIDFLRSELAIDGDVYNLGRAEGNADFKVEVRKIVDPEDKKHLNLTGVLKEVKDLVKFKEQTKKVITWIYRSNALKKFAYDRGNNELSIAELTRNLCHKANE